MSLKNMVCAQDLNYQELGPKLQRLKKLIFCLAEGILEHFELTDTKRHPFSIVFGICSENRSRELRKTFFNEIMRFY